MHLAVIGNQDNTAYRFSKWLRAMGWEADLFVFLRSTGLRSHPELIDRELGKDGSPTYYDTEFRLFEQTILIRTEV